MLFSSCAVFKVADYNQWLHKYRLCLYAFGCWDYLHGCIMYSWILACAMLHLTVMQRRQQNTTSTSLEAIDVAHKPTASCATICDVVSHAHTRMRHGEYQDISASGCTLPLSAILRRASLVRSRKSTTAV